MRLHHRKLRRRRARQALNEQWNRMRKEYDSEWGMGDAALHQLGGLLGLLRATFR